MDVEVCRAHLENDGSRVTTMDDEKPLLRRRVIHVMNRGAAVRSDPDLLVRAPRARAGAILVNEPVVFASKPLEVGVACPIPEQEDDRSIRRRPLQPLPFNRKAL